MGRLATAFGGIMVAFHWRQNTHGVGILANGINALAMPRQRHHILLQMMAQLVV
jgi:hypothetical protein